MALARPNLGKKKKEAGYPGGFGKKETPVGKLPLIQRGGGGGGGCAERN